MSDIAPVWVEFTLSRWPGYPVGSDCVVAEYSPCGTDFDAAIYAHLYPPMVAADQGQVARLQEFSARRRWPKALPTLLEPLPLGWHSFVWIRRGEIPQRKVQNDELGCANFRSYDHRFGGYS
jgi:hypothetical protein